MRADVRKQDFPQAWPPLVVEAEESGPIMPESVILLLRYLLTDTKENGHASQRVQRLVSSFGHNLMYSITHGKTKLPKHIILLSIVKSLTGNVELNQTLNQLRRSVSYSQVEEIDTALCLQKLCVKG